MPNDGSRHPGEYIKAEVIPTGLSIKKAAELVGVGRPALSNLLNGKAALSSDMALRLEKAFGVKREVLLQRQAEYDEEQSRHREREVAVRAYAPSFLDIKAMQVAAWAERLDARAQLPALLRKLVFTTGTNLAKVDFPAYDNAQRPGWDGYVETDTATPWIPSGPSGWEFGCNKEPQEKANEDYAARTASVPLAERKKLTFVFVTPRDWPKKDDWIKQKCADKRWKEVRAFDANDLEQWLEQSVPAQSWLAERLGNAAEDILSPEECWDRWANVTKPQLTKTLFEASVESHRNSLADWLKAPPSTPFIITSDSEEESLAYLACALEAAGEYADRAVVLRTATALRRVTKASSNFIAVLVTPEVEAASAGLHKVQHTIIVRKRSGVENEPDIALDLVADETFKKGLIEMKIEEEEVPTLSRASGQSLTILRRRLSDVPAIKFPPWAEDNTLSRKLIPLGFASAWDSQSTEDKQILSFLMNDKYEAIEEAVTELLKLEHSPVWAIGRYRGVASKLDVLYATHRLVTRADLENFFLTARLVLSERDPSLDLPEEKRYAASIYGKTRNHSDALRAAMCETLVLLAIHGSNLFRERLGYDVEGHVNATVRELLMPFASETWASQKSNLPHYAEAAPDVFLDIIQQDLQSDDPKILALLQPASTEMFGGGCPRSGLLWALELLAWKPERLPRVAAILARMCETKINDNWSNKPENSLRSIFRAWMPQTAATVEERCGVLETITRRFRDVGWRLCTDQFDPGSTVGDYNHRPHWRKDASGAGQPVTRGEAYTFARKAVDLAIGWTAHTEDTLGDLIQRMEGLEDTDQALIWDKVRSWIATDPGDERKAVLRERIRVYSFTRRAMRHGKQPSNVAREIYDQLIASDPVLRHQWLFARQWVEESWDEIEDDNLDYHKREERIAQARSDAIAEVWQTSGYGGIFRLCRSGEAANEVGYHLARLAPAGLDPTEFMTRLLAETDPSSAASFNMCLSGFLFKLDDAGREKLLTTVIDDFKAEGKPGEDKIIRLLKRAPCKKSTWSIVDGLPVELQAAYWANASSNWISDDQDEIRELVERLLLVKRPSAAFASVRLHTEKLESATLFRLLKDMATISSELDASIRFNSHDIGRALKVLDDRADVSRDDMAHLEFLYLSALEHEKRGVPNLERQIAETPALFVQAVGLTFKRRGSGEDPADWNITDEKARTNVATQTYRLLHKVRRIPGTGEDGSVDLEKLRAWMKEVRALCKSYGREDAGDSCIGELLSKSGRADDGIWPLVPVRDVLEEMGNQKISEGMAIGLQNQRGVHWRDVGGRQERDLATMYRDWSKQTAVEWPFTSRVLGHVAESYEREAAWHDTDANLRRRLPS